MLAGFFSPYGRSPVLKTLLTLCISLAIGGIGILLIRDGSIVVVTLVGALLGATAAKLGVELARRRHDRGARGWTVIIGLVIFALAFLAYLAFVIPATSFYVVVACGGAGLGWILLAPGNPESNAFGPPPANPFASSGVAGARISVVIGLFLTVGGALAGFGGAFWLDAIARRQAENERWSQEQLQVRGSQGEDDAMQAAVGGNAAETIP